MSDRSVAWLLAHQSTSEEGVILELAPAGDPNEVLAIFRVESTGTLRRPNDPQAYSKLSFESEEMGGAPISVFGDPHQLSVANDKPGVLRVESTRRVMEIVKDPHAHDHGPNQATLDHEHQHQWNNLDIIAHEIDTEKQVSEITEGDLWIGHAADEIVRLKAKELRYRVADVPARDEIIAYWVQGADTKTLHRTVSQDPGFDFAAKASGDINELVGSVASDLETLAEKRDFYGDEILETEQIVAKIQQVFEADYQRDLSRWVGALEQMEAKGYSRQEILGIVQPLPAGKWTDIAWRLQDRTGEDVRHRGEMKPESLEPEAKSEPEPEAKPEAAPSRWRRGLNRVKRAFGRP